MSGMDDMKVTKAVIPAAGLGTRVLPASKSVPKEMLPLVDKPVIQHIVEEAVNSGITDILIVTNRGKSVMEDHFDYSPELESRLLASKKEALHAEMRAITELANITYVRQRETKGLGHAVLCAERFVGSEPFAVLYGDDVILGDTPATLELKQTYEKYGLGVLGVKQVGRDVIGMYSSVSRDRSHESGFLVTEMIEKPTPQQVLTDFAIIGRVVLPSEIFAILRDTPPGAGGEIQLTDAMATLAAKSGMVGCEYSGTRFDMGNKLGILEAWLNVAVTHPEIGEKAAELIKRFALGL